MKKKIATILLFLFSCLGVLTGCNLFTTNNVAGLSSVVATSGSVSVTREQLINAYNSSGYYYNQYYGYTMEGALKQTIQDLINREYLLKYIEEKSQTDETLQLTNKEKYDVILETWEYIDTSIESVREQIEKELGLYNSKDEGTSSDSASEEFSGYTPYTTKFVKDINTNLIYLTQEEDGESGYVPAISENTKYEYNFDRVLKGYSSDLKTIIKNRYISSLKKSESYYGTQLDNSDNAVFRRQIDNIFKTNLENAKMQKFQDTVKNSFGLQYDESKGEHYLIEDTLTKMIEKYTSVYDSNKEVYEDAKARNSNSYFNTITNSSNRNKYFYYGNGEEDLLTCIHILVKLSDEQLAKISEYESDPYIQDDLDSILTIAKSQQKTFATERDFETGKEVENGQTLSVKQLFNNLTNDINNISYGYESSMYLEEITKVFNKYIYTYGMDTGIMNAQFDYIVGSKTSPMVESFTDVVRKLYNNGIKNTTKNYKVTAGYNEEITLNFPNGVGYAGAYSEPFLEENSNYSGYHIVLFTGKLKNIDPSVLSTNNLFDKLSEKTSISYNESLFEMLYDMVATDNYNTIQSNILKTNPAIVYNTSNFSDLY